MEKQTFTIPQFIDQFEVGRTTVYEQIANGNLATYKVGRRRYISAHAAAEWQRRMESETAANSASFEDAIHSPISA